MKLFVSAIMFVLLPFGLCMADTAPAPIIQTSVFSTSTDWEAISGLRLSQFYVDFSGDNDLIKNGLELYFLDSFPCFAQTDSSRVWIGQNGKTDGKIRLTCLFPPENVYFAWRNVNRDAGQDKTTGILECPVSGDNDLKIDLSKCIKNRDWKEYK